jgi:hypothetical protein
MLKLITTKSVAVAATAAIAAVMAIFLTVAPAAKAPQVTTAVVEHILAKGDRLLPVVMGAACSGRSWPNYEQNCQFDLRQSADHVRPVRVLDLERAGTSRNVVIASR